MALEQSLDFLRKLSEWFDRQAAAAEDAQEAEKYIVLSRGVLKERNVIQEWLRETNAKRGSAIQLTPDDLEGLPEDLKAELSLSESEQFELNILRLIEEAGGKISLDVLLVSWYRSKKEVIKRRTMTARIYRMLSKERLYSTPGYKGVYQLQKPPKAEGRPSAAGHVAGPDSLNPDGDAGYGEA